MRWGIAGTEKPANRAPAGTTWKAVGDLHEAGGAPPVDRDDAVLAAAAQAEAQVKGRTIEHEIVGAPVRRREQLGRHACPLGAMARRDMIRADLQRWKHERLPLPMKACLGLETKS